MFEQDTFSSATSRPLNLLIHAMEKPENANFQPFSESVFIWFVNVRVICELFTHLIMEIAQLARFDISINTSTNALISSQPVNVFICRRLIRYDERFVVNWTVCFTVDNEQETKKGTKSG